MAGEVNLEGLWGRLWLVLTSGLFFMLVGGVFLLLAANTLGHIHAAFSFVLVVLGCAILLFGTGTQGMGEFTSPDNPPVTFIKYKIGIAGGAGILALAIGLGMVHEREGIRDVFQIERRYARVLLTPFQADGVSTFKYYVAEAHTADGTPVPTQHRSDDSIEIIVPYFVQQTPEIVVLVTLSNVQQGNQGNGLLSQVKRGITVDLNRLYDNSGGMEYPIYRAANPEETTFNLQSPAATQVVFSKADDHQGRLSERQPPNRPEPPIINVQ
jgi:hypothetical protein